MDYKVDFDKTKQLQVHFFYPDISVITSISVKSFCPEETFHAILYDTTEALIQSL